MRCLCCHQPLVLPDGGMFAKEIVCGGCDAVIINRFPLAYRLVVAAMMVVIGCVILLNFNAFSWDSKTVVDAFLVPLAFLVGAIIVVFGGERYDVQAGTEDEQKVKMLLDKARLNRQQKIAEVNANIERYKK